MSLHTFTLVLDSPRALTPGFEAAVFQAGCSDAALGRRSGALYLEFDREAPSFLDAVLSAIRQVHRIPRASVAHVEPDELVTASDIARRTGRSRESVRLLVEGARGPGGFPVPVSGSRGGGGRLWRWSEVARWLGAHKICETAREDPHVIAAVNGALALSRNAGEEDRRKILRALGKAS